MPAVRDKIFAGVQSAVKYHARTSTALYVVGILVTLLYPLLARRAFIDENAFLLGQTNFEFGWEDVRAAEMYAARGLDAVRRRAAEDASEYKDEGGANGSGGGGDATDALRAWVASELERMQLETYVQDFPPPSNHATGGLKRRGGRGWGWGSHVAPDVKPDVGFNTTAAAIGRNLHSVARAPKGSGREGIVLATPIGDAASTPEADAAALGLALALLARLSAAPWLAKDIAWVVPDARWGGGVAGADAWLREYHHPSTAAVAARSFGRVGAIQQAYVLELPHGEATPDPYAPYPTPCVLLSTPSSIHPDKCVPYPIPYNLYPTPCILHSTPYTLHPLYHVHYTPLPIAYTHTLSPSKYIPAKSPLRVATVNHGYPFPRRHLVLNRTILHPPGTLCPPMRLFTPRNNRLSTDGFRSQYKYSVFM
jgi:hypothetical protein